MFPLLSGVSWLLACCWLVATSAQYYPGGVGGMGFVGAMGTASAGHTGSGGGFAGSSGGFAGSGGGFAGGPIVVSQPAGYPIPALAYTSGYPIGYPSTGYQPPYPNYIPYATFASGGPPSGTLGCGSLPGLQASDSVNENANTNVNINGGSFRRSLRGPAQEMSNANVNTNSNANLLRSVTLRTSLPPILADN